MTTATGVATTRPPMTSARSLALGLGCDLRSWSASSLTGSSPVQADSRSGRTEILACRGSFLTSWTRLFLVDPVLLVLGVVDGDAATRAARGVTRVRSGRAKRARHQ